MITKDDARNTLEFDDYYVIKPDFRFFAHRFNDDGGKPVPDGFEYSSGDNQWKLDVHEMRLLINNI